MSTERVDFQQLIDEAEDLVSDAQNQLTCAAANLALVVGPLAACHRVAEITIELREQAQREGLLPASPARKPEKD
ncbi:MAG: hypothetical protein AAF739_16890 [Pseudomonadota bacterium]